MNVWELYEALDPNSEEWVLLDNDQVRQLEEAGINMFGHQKLTQWYLHMLMTCAYDEAASKAKNTLLR